MHCPLTGKPCVMPKEVFVTETTPQGVRHLYMCRICGDEYIKQLNNAEVITKSLEVVSSDGNVSYSEHTIEGGSSHTEAMEEMIEEEEREFTPEKQKINKIKAIEAKILAAADAEDYKLAAKLRDELKKLRGK